ncbi:MAG: hypothetical protein ACHQHN_03295 [Sphingobacteriales bacterium]
MRYKLIILFSIISLSASAQLHINLDFLKRKHIILPPITKARGYHFNSAAATRIITPVDVHPYLLDETVFALMAREKVILKTVKHNMSWRIYNEASYNFSDLAGVYIKLHRLSEAKWYLLQSNNLSREERDNKHTIANLISLASVKNDIGDAVSARADLVEAHDMATGIGMKEKAEEINKKIQLLDQIKPVPATKYAEATENR